MRFRIRYAQQIVGLFLVAALLSILTIFVLMGLNQRWFARSYTFYTRFQSAEGLTNGMSIRLKGFEVGKVADVQLNSLNRVSLTLQIYEEYYQKIRPDSVIELAVSPIGLGGGMNLLPGKNTLPPVEEYSFLPSTDTILGKALMNQGLVDRPQGNEAINGIIAQIEPLLKEVRTTASSVNQLLANVNGAVEGSSDNQFAVLLRDVHKTLGTVERSLSDTSINANALLKNVTGITANVETLTSQLKDPKGLIPKLLDPKGSMATLLDDNNAIFNQITQILNQVNSTMKEVRSLAVYLNASTPQISGIMEDTKTTLKKTTDVMEGLSNNPLLKGGIPDKKPQSSTFRSIRDEEF